MAKRFIIIISLLFPITITFADTHIPGGDVSGIWTFPNSPYIIDGKINIPVDSTLVIEPGIQVIFSEHYKFNIYGRLLAKGTLSDTIIFTVGDTTGFSNFYSNDGGWHSLRFYNTNTNGQDSSKVVYCILEYGKATGYYPDDQGGAIYLCYSSNILIKNCLITTNVANSDGGGIYCSNSSPIITNNIISYNTGDPGGGISCGNDSNPIISNNKIKYNIACSTAGTNIGAGISCFYSSSTVTDNIISNNNIPDYGHGGGSYIYYPSANLVIPSGIDDWHLHSKDIVLSQNYPNPFSTTTTISFYLATCLRQTTARQAKPHENTQIKIYNVKGQMVRQLFPITIGINSKSSIVWDGKDENGNLVNSGLYFYQLKIGDKLIDTKKSLLMR